MYFYIKYIVRITAVKGLIEELENYKNVRYYKSSPEKVI